MGKAIIQEFRAHPLGTMVVIMTCIGLSTAGITWVKAQGAKSNQDKNDIQLISNSVQTIASKVEKHIEETSYEKQVEQFPTRREYSDTVIHIKNGQKRLEADMVEQRKLSIEILKRLPQ